MRNYFHIWKPPGNVEAILQPFGNMAALTCSWITSTDVNLASSMSYNVTTIELNLSYLKLFRMIYLNYTSKDELTTNFC